MTRVTVNTILVALCSSMMCVSLNLVMRAGGHFDEYANHDLFSAANHKLNVLIQSRIKLVPPIGHEAKKNVEQLRSQKEAELAGVVNYYSATAERIVESESNETERANAISNVIVAQEEQNSLIKNDERVKQGIEKRRINDNTPIVWNEEPTESKPFVYQYVKDRRPTMPDFYDSGYACRNFTSDLPIPENRTELPDRHPFDFSTYVKSKINVIFLGDSLAVELGTWFQIAGQAKTRDHLVMLDWAKTKGVGLATAKVDGGGMVGVWRILGFLMKKFLGYPLPNWDFGWSKKWTRALMNNTKTHNVESKYHVMVFRVSHPWLRPENVSSHELDVTTGVAKRQFGMDVITIFQTAPFNNNVVLDDFKPAEHWWGLHTSKLHDFRDMNQRIRDFVAGKNSSKILLSDVELYMDNVMEWNAKQIGVGGDIESRMSHLQECDSKRTFRKHIVQMCSEKVPHNSSDCVRNMLSADGMHFCMSTLGPRLIANSGCLIQCAYGDKARVRECESHCNRNIFDLSKSMEDLQAMQ